ncbi:hypothetical protein V8C40DRAFT_285731 [Trichoderma camerunense]
MLGGGACRPRGWDRWCQSTVRLEGERSAFNESEGVLLHCAPLTRLLAQQCFRQRKCREGLAAPRNLLSTCLSRSQWWFLDQSFAPVDHFLLLSQQGVSGRRLSFRCSTARHSLAFHSRCLFLLISQSRSCFGQRCLVVWPRLYPIPSLSASLWKHAPIHRNL